MSGSELHTKEIRPTFCHFHISNAVVIGNKNVLSDFDKAQLLCLGTFPKERVLFSCPKLRIITGNILGSQDLLRHEAKRSFRINTSQQKGYCGTHSFNRNKERYESKYNTLQLVSHNIHAKEFTPAFRKYRMKNVRMAKTFYDRNVMINK